jgi:YggT family protein
VYHELIRLLIQVLSVYSWLIIIRVLLSWIPLPESAFIRSVYRALYQLTEPYLAVFRRVIPSVGAGGMGLDLSPMLAILVIFLVQNLLSRI